MNKLCIISAIRLERILRLKECAEQMVPNVVDLYQDRYNYNHSYIANKLVRWGVSKADKEFYAEQIRAIRTTINKVNPEAALFVNTGMTDKWIKEELGNKKIKICFWLVDALSDNPQSFSVADNFFYYAYDKQTEQKLKDSGINCKYVPVGFNDAYHASEEVNRDIDISFVGTPYKKRLKLLEKVAEAALQNKWNFRVYGPFFEQPYFWKPVVFKFAYPALAHFVQNVTLTPTQINEIYNKSKIVINIHNDENKGVNPRTFEIMASGAMQLLDTREDYDIIRPGIDAAVYHDSDELIAQIEYYLSHDGERELIARSGHESVKTKRSMVNSLRTILAGE